MRQLVEFFTSFVIIALVIVGISGISYNLFREDGWIEAVAGQIWNLEIQYTLIALPVLIGAGFLFNLWRGNRVVHSKTSLIPNLLLYSLMGAGLYYISQYVLTGSI